MTDAGRLLADHLWQSTAFAALAWLLARLLRSNRAAVRHALWVATSLKFLVPFAVLGWVGAYLGTRTAAAQPMLGVFVDVLSQPLQPFSQPSARMAPAIAASTGPAVFAIVPRLLFACWAAGSAWLIASYITRWRQVRTVVREAAPVQDGPEVVALRRAERQAGMATRIVLVATEGSFEPGIFGIARPVLLWPRRLSEHLSEEQVESILAHEVSHVRRRDNLFAALHMAVEIAFWFHPLVWWLGARLVDERERACDEDVISSGHAREAYAESLLETCRLSVEVPLACVSGVTGADLKKRVERIMRSHAVDALTPGRKALLAAAVVMAVAVPIAEGVAKAPRLFAHTAPQTADGVRIEGEMQLQVEKVRTGFEVATPRAAGVLKAGQPRPAFEITSVKPNAASGGRISVMRAPGGGWEATNVTLGLLVKMAYQLQDSQIVGGPAWLFSDRFDLQGKGTAPGPDGPFMDKVQSLLADRFGLVVHTETRDMPIYALTVSRRDRKLGSQLHPSSFDCPNPARAAAGDGPPPPPPPPLPSSRVPAVGLDALANVERPSCGMRISPGGMLAGGLTMSMLARSLSQIVGRIVIDHTRLDGNYDWDLGYAPDPGMAGRSDFPPLPPGATTPVVKGPSIFAALHEQLGLTLESRREPVEVLVVDRAELPARN